MNNLTKFLILSFLFASFIILTIIAFFHANQNKCPQTVQNDIIFETAIFNGSLKVIINRQSYEAFAVLSNDDIVGEYVNSTDDLSFKRVLGVWNAQTGELKFSLDGHLNPIILVTVIEKSLVASCDQYVCKIWNISSQSLKFSFNSSKISLMISLSSVDKLLAIGHSNGYISIWNYMDNIRIHYLEAHNKNIRCLLALEKRNYIISSGESGKIKVWKYSLANIILLFTLKNHQKAVTSIVAMGSNRFLASCSLDKTILLWDLNDGSLKFNLTGHKTEIIKLIVWKDIFLISGDLSGLIRVWRLENNYEMKFHYNLIGHERNIRDLVVLRNGDLISGDVSGSFLNHSNLKKLKSISKII